MLRLHSSSHPQSTDAISTNAHSRQHHDMRGKLFPFNQQSMRFNVSFTSTSPHTAILVTDGWSGGLKQRKVLFTSEEEITIT